MLLGEKRERIASRRTSGGFKEQLQSKWGLRSEEIGRCSGLSPESWSQSQIIN